MPGESTHRTLKAFKEDGVAHAVAIIRDNIEDDEQRIRRREYEQYLARMMFLSGLSQFSYEHFDYTPYLERKEFIPPETPDFSYLAPEAEKRTREEYKPHVKAVGGVLALAIFVDLLILGTPAGILSILSVLTAGGILHQQMEKQRRAVAAAIAAAEAEAERLLAKFHEEVDHARIEFDYDEGERIAALQKLLAGKPDSVLDVCQKTATTIELPFILRGGIEISDADAILSFKLPSDEFVPRLEWTEDRPGKYSNSERTATSFNHLYAEAIAAGMLQVVLRIFEQVPTLENIAVNCFRQMEDRQICLMGVTVSRENLQDLTRAEGGLKFIEEHGSIRIQTGFSLATVEPVVTERLANTLEREVLKGGVHCSVKTI